MCGRFVSRVDAASEQYWSVIQSWPASFESWNVAPSQDVPVLLLRDGQRAGVYYRWGLVPFWAKGETPRYSTINARAETVHSAASYRGPWARSQRCILPVLGFYEWKAESGGKQPYFIRMAGGEPFGLAGLWDESVKPTGETVHSCTIITTEANPLVAEIHAKGRMPVIVTTDTAGVWLEGSRDEAHAMLAPFPADLMDAYRVSRRVNSPRNNAPELLEPV